jgi:hypothetical protein
VTFQPISLFTDDYDASPIFVTVTSFEPVHRGRLVARVSAVTSVAPGFTLKTDRVPIVRDPCSGLRAELPSILLTETREFVQPVTWVEPSARSAWSEQVVEATLFEFGVNCLDEPPAEGGSR